MIVMMVNDKTRFWNALRPFSFVVALSSCLLGVMLAVLDGSTEYILAGLLILLGVVLQAAVNLINDHSDRYSSKYNGQQRKNIKRNMQWGVFFFVIVIIGGLYLVSLRGIGLLILGAVGLLGAWGYTSAPVNYKQRGLGVVLVFFLMGVMMIGGCYFTMTGEYTSRIFWLSIPFSFFTSLLLLANELRDFEKDFQDNITTLTVRVGFEFSTRLYVVMLLSIYLASAWLYWRGMISTLVLLLLTLVALPGPLRMLKLAPADRRFLPQLTGRLFLGYSIAFMTTLWWEPVFFI